MEYSKEEGKILLKLARDSIMEEFNSVKPELPTDKKFRQARGVFVTLTENGKLRGCIGFPYPNFALNSAVYKAAKEAAFSDSRFKKITENQMNNIKIEISILSSPIEIKDIKEIKVGVDGLICNFMGMSGLLLPQVAIEFKLDRIGFLEALCNKAGLPKDNWQNDNFKLWKFQAEIFSE